MIELKNVSAGYGKEEILHQINLTFEKGSITVLVGPNGCGKSTLLKTILGINVRRCGEILVDHKKIETLDGSALAQKVAYLPQGRPPADISVFRMVLHGRFPYLKYPRRYRKEDFAIARKALRWVGIEDLAEKNVNQLSGGTQQKVYLAMALAQDTDTILLDEPTTFLDVSHQMNLMDLAKKLAKEGKAVVMVLHDLPQAFLTADKIAVLQKGQIKCCGAPEEIFSSSAIQETFGVTMERVKTAKGYGYFCHKME